MGSCNFIVSYVYKNLLDCKYRIYYIIHNMTMQEVITLFRYPELLVYCTDNDSDLFSSHLGNFACVYFNFQGKPHTLSIVYPTKILVTTIDFRIGLDGEIESFPVEDENTNNTFINYSDITLDKLKDIIYNCYTESVLNAKNFLVKLKKDDINKDFT